MSKNTVGGTIIVDNYDSFTFNVAQILAEIAGEEPVVLPNSVPWREIRKIPHRRIILSPGPGAPSRAADVGSSMDVLRFAECPVLGICLGHQCLVAHFGGDVGRAPEPFHGRISRIHCRPDPLFAGLPAAFDVTRYHSLIAHRPLPDCLECIAETGEGLVMAVRHRLRPLWGVQFHPESICSEQGAALLANFVRPVPLRQAAGLSGAVRAARREAEAV
ncbi:aminodeoxychorismate/anthranilate synthase component II [Stappia sp. ES.058]|uniref:anthranilate synthase component II n=1 Tax=Stappia sp. ES.058 TaxID=1881061 RepID=UPI00087C951F|nr:aminodeoxychorismate/anthranilate synthase component II [Stappia sp. ES.058]SDU46234.1 anthranilate synthase, component II [Stappia sp. ES.058]